MRFSSMAKTKPLKTIRDIVELWPSHADCAAAVLGDPDLSYRPRDWAARGRLPVEIIGDFVTAAHAIDRRVTAELVLNILKKEAA